MSDRLRDAIAPHPDGAVLSLLVTPRAGKTAFARVEGDAVRLRVAAPPVDGAANAAVVRFLAEAFGLPKRSVRILSGDTGRRKRVLLVGLAPEAVAFRLASGGVATNGAGRSLP